MCLLKCVASPEDKLITSKHYLENHDEDDGDNENEDKDEVHEPHTTASWEISVLDDIQEREFLRKDIENVKDRIYIKMVVSSVQCDHMDLLNESAKNLMTSYLAKLSESQY